MPRDDDAVQAGDAPRLPGDLPPLPSKHYRPRPPRPACQECGKRFDTAEELNEHARRAHLPRLGKEHSH